MSTVSATKRSRFSVLPTPAVTQVLESLEHGPRRHGGERRQLRVRLGLPAEGQQRNAQPRATPPQLLQALGPRPPSAQQPHQHEPVPQTSSLSKNDAGSPSVTGLAHLTSGKPSGRRSEALAAARISVSAVVSSRSFGRLLLRRQAFSLSAIRLCLAARRRSAFATADDESSAPAFCTRRSRSTVAPFEPPC